MCRCEALCLSRPIGKASPTLEWEAFLAGYARAKVLPSQGSWPSLRGLRGFAAFPSAPNKKKKATDGTSHTIGRFILHAYACLNRLRNSTVLGFCGRSKMSAGVPSSQMTPSAM